MDARPSAQAPTHNHLMWGIDLGGTKIEGVVLRSVEPLDVACRLRIPTDADRCYKNILQRIGLLIEMLSDEASCRRPSDSALARQAPSIPQPD